MKAERNIPKLKKGMKIFFATVRAPLFMSKRRWKSCFKKLLKHIVTHVEGNEIATYHNMGRPADRNALLKSACNGNDHHLLLDQKGAKYLEKLNKKYPLHRSSHPREYQNEIRETLQESRVDKAKESIAEHLNQLRVFCVHCGGNAKCSSDLYCMVCDNDYMKSSDEKALVEKVLKGAKIEKLKYPTNITFSPLKTAKVA